MANDVGAADPHYGCVEGNTLDSAIAGFARDEKAEESREARKVACGVLDASGDEMLVVVFSLEGFNGGNLWRQYLAVFRVEATNSLTLATKRMIGGKNYQTVESMRIDSNTILLDTMENIPTDASCCPSRPGTMQFAFVNGRLVSDQLNDPAQPSAHSEEPMVQNWSGRVGEFDYRWDGNDFEVSSGKGKTLRLFSTDAKSRVQVEQTTNDAKGCSFSSYYRPLAVAGSLVSFDIEFSTLCGGAIDNSWGYSTIKIIKGQEGELVFDGVSLSDIFPDTELLQAFSREPKISHSISKLISVRKIGGAPGTFTELKRLMAKFPNDFLGGRYYLADSIDSFALRSVDGEQLTLWISLLPTAPPEAALRDHLELTLPLPPKYRDALLAASSRKAGFVMQDADSVVGDAFAEFEFTSRTTKTQ